jgi:hypothetical protein
MLAYLDGLLEPEDAKDIGKKIEDSKFATDMLNRVRDVMRRLRLTAPPLTERDPLSNANTVAEYLDNVLPGDRVAEFEEVCLKSDVHLAEVASSHQILTLVLGEAAEIDLVSRQRMYQLPQVAATAEEERRAAVAAAAVIAGDGAAADAASRGRPRPLVPAYLREPSRKRRLLPAAAMLLLAGGLAGLLLMFLGQFERNTPLGNLIERARSYFTGAARPELAGNELQSEFPSAKAGRTPAKASGVEGDSPSFVGRNLGQSPPAAASEAAKPAPGSAESAAGPAAGPEAKGPAEKGKVGPSATAIGRAGKPPAESAKPSETAKPAEGVKPTETAKPAETAQPLKVATLDAKARMKADTRLGPEVERPAVGEPPPAVPGGKAGTPPPPAPEAAAGARVGRVISDAQDILVKDDVASAVWRRVSAEEFLPAGEALVALPTYRPRVVILSVGATLELLSGTRIELTDDSGQGRPGLKLSYGRVVLKPLVQPGIRVRVAAGPRSGSITLSSVESVAAVEVTPIHEPGSDPESGPFHWSVTLYAARGGLVWDEGRATAAVPLTAPARLVLVAPPAGSPPADAKDTPKWVAIDTVSPLEQRASVFVAQALQPERPAGLVLMELIEDRRSEVRLLAARCLGYLGQCGPLVAALNDEKFKREWPAYIDQLRQAVARGPEAAAAVRQAMERQFGQDSASLYRMLWGYTDKDLLGGEDTRLVKFLDHEILAFRVLAFGSLKDISGNLGSHYYRPELPADKRQPLVQRWTQEQAAGKIRHRTPEDKIRASAESAQPAAGEQPAGGEPPVPPPPRPGSDLPPAKPAAPESGPPPPPAPQPPGA